MASKTTGHKKDCCATRVLEVVPAVMCAIRADIMDSGLADLTPPQYRMLGLVFEAPRTVTQLALATNASPAAVSRMVEGLVKRDLIIRTQSEEDRRQVSLTISSKGKKIYEATREQTRRKLEDSLRKLPETKRKTIVEAMDILDGLFTPDLECTLG